MEYKINIIKNILSKNIFANVKKVNVKQLHVHALKMELSVMKWVHVAADPVVIQKDYPKLKEIT